MSKFTVIQTTKINSGDFTFLSPDNVTYPVAPLVSVKLYHPLGVPTLKIRATLYINSKKSKEPNVKAPVETGDSLKLVFKSNFTDETPETCDVWYVELDYTSATVENITNVVSYLKNPRKTAGLTVGIDPTTSRGTVTDTQG